MNVVKVKRARKSKKERKKNKAKNVGANNHSNDRARHSHLIQVADEQGPAHREPQRQPHRHARQAAAARVHGPLERGEERADQAQREVLVLRGQGEALGEREHQADGRYRQRAGALGRRDASDTRALRAESVRRAHQNRRRGQPEDHSRRAHQALPVREQRVPATPRRQPQAEQRRQDAHQEPRGRAGADQGEERADEEVDRRRARRDREVSHESRRHVVAARRAARQARRRALQTHLGRVQQSDAARAHRVHQGDQREGAARDEPAVGRVALQRPDGVLQRAAQEGHRQHTQGLRAAAHGADARARGVDEAQVRGAGGQGEREGRAVRARDGDAAGEHRVAAQHVRVQ